MTTIAASLAFGMMAADARTRLISTSTGEDLHAYSSTKLVRLGEWIVGGAGDDVDIDAFLAWLPDRRKRRKKVTDDFAALLLSRTKLIFVTDNGPLESVRNGYMAVGTGGGFALAAMGALARVGHPTDPRIAVEVACEHDTGSAPPIDFLTWKKDVA